MASLTENDRLDHDDDMASLRKRSAHGAAMTLVTQAAKFGVSFGSQLVMAHLLVPAEFGLVAMASPVIGFVSIFNDLGLSQAVVQRQEITQAEISTLFWINLSASVVLALALVIASPVVGLVYHDRAVIPIVIALAILMIPGSAGSQSVALMNRRMQFTRLAWLDLGSAAIGAGAGIAAALSGLGAWSLIVAQAAVTIPYQVMVWAYAGWHPSRPAYDRGAGAMLRFGGHLTAFNVVSFFSSYFDRVLVGILNGAAVLGLFDRAFRLMNQPLAQINGPVNRVAVPTLARMLHEPDTYRTTFIRMLQLMLILSTPALVAVAVMSHRVVLALLGHNWIGTGPILSWLCIAGIFSTFTGSTYWMFVSQGRAREQMTCGFISSALIVVSLFVGLPWGPVGIAAAYAAFSPVVHGLFVWVGTRSGPVGRRDVLLGTYPMALGAVAAASSLFAIVPHLGSGHWIPLVLGGIVAYVVFAAVMIATPHGFEAVRSLSRLVRMVREARAA